MTSPETRMLRWRTAAFAAWAIIGLGVILYFAGRVLGLIAPAVWPFVIAFILVFLLRVPVTLLVRRGMSRTWAIILCYALGLGLLAGLMVFLVPLLVDQIDALLKQAPVYLARAEDVVTRLQRQYSDVAFPEWFVNLFRSITGELATILTRVGNALAQILVAAGSGIATGVFDLVLAMILAFWILKDLPKMRQEVTVLAGERYEQDVENLLETVVKVVGGYLRGQAIVSASTSTLLGVGLAIIGVPYALLLTMIAFILNFIPYIGPLLIGLIAAGVGLFVSPLTALLAIAVAVGAQLATDNLITPHVMSEQVDLHPTLVIFSLLAGGALFGIAGMFFAIPVAATLKGLFVYYFERRTRRPLGSEDGALFKTSSDDECGQAEPAHAAEDAERGPDGMTKTGA